MSTKNNIDAVKPIDTPEVVLDAPKEANNKPCPRVYCGPSLRGIARQFTVYTEKLPDPLLDFVKQHPMAAGLIVSIADFAAVRCRVEQRGTAENILFHKIKSEL